MYFDRSGRGGQGGTVAFSTYFDISGIGGQVGQEAMPAAAGAGAPEAEPAAEPEGQSHGFFALHL